MTSAELLLDGFDRVRGAVHESVADLSPDDLTTRVDGSANSIAWLTWHLTRVQDDHLAGAFQRTQVWNDESWIERFGLPFDPADTGYGHSSGQVAAVRVDNPDLLTGYHDATHARTADLIAHVTDNDLEQVIDASWDPPTTLGVRLISVIADGLQHAGQAALIRGILLRRSA